MQSDNLRGNHLLPELDVWQNNRVLAISHGVRRCEYRNVLWKRNDCVNSLIRAISLICSYIKSFSYFADRAQTTRFARMRKSREVALRTEISLEGFKLPRGFRSEPSGSGYCSSHLQPALYPQPKAVAQPSEREHCSLSRCVLGTLE